MNHLKDGNVHKLFPVCEWCGKDSFGRVFTIEPARMGTIKGQPVLKRRAILAPVCETCETRLKAGLPQESAPVVKG